MNYLVFVDTRAGELEKILSGVKTMLIKEFDPDQPIDQLVQAGDNLYFLRNKDDCAVRVKATVVRALPIVHGADQELPRFLKELQPRLQFTEDQYNNWSTRKQALLIEFEAAQKVPEFHIAPGKITDRTSWISFEEIQQVTEEGVKDGTSKDFTS